MSEIGREGPKPDIKDKLPKKDEVKLQETTGTPEKKLPLSKKLSAAIKYISASVSEGKSREADDELTYISQEGGKPKTLKEHLEKEREPKEFRFQLSGSKIPVEIMRAKELPEEMVLNVVLTGGAQAGIGNAEAVVRMMEMGLFDKKNLKINFWGISAGAANAAYAATGVDKAKEAVKMYTQENLGYTVDENDRKVDTGGKLVYLPDGKAAQLEALFEARPGKPLVDTEYVADNIASGKRRLDVEALKVSKYGVFVRLMNEDGGQEWVDLKQEKDPANTLRGAICVPGVSRKPFIERDGKKYADGAFAEGPLLDEIFKREGDDAKVLIISNGSFGKGGQMEIVQKILGMKAKKGGEDAYGYNEKVAKLIATHNNEAKIQGKEVWDRIVEGKNVTIMELTRDSDFVPELEKDPEKLKKAGEKFAEFAGNTFDLEKELPLKSHGLMTAEGELRAIGASGKPTELKFVEDPKIEVEISSGNSNAGTEKADQVVDSTGKHKELKQEEGVLKPEKTISEQIWEEKLKLFSYFYGDTSDKTVHIEEINRRKAKEANMEVRDWHNIELTALKSLNAQIDKYIPKKFRMENDLSKHGIRYPVIPSYMIRVDNNSGEATYDPFYKPSVLSKLAKVYSEAGLGWINKIPKYILDSATIEKPDKSVVKELQDYYTKAKAEEKKPA